MPELDFDFTGLGNIGTTERPKLNPSKIAKEALGRTLFPFMPQPKRIIEEPFKVLREMTYGFPAVTLLQLGKTATVRGAMGEKVISPETLKETFVRPRSIFEIPELQKRATEGKKSLERVYPNPIVRQLIKKMPQDTYNAIIETGIDIPLLYKVDSLLGKFGATKALSLTKQTIKQTENFAPRLRDLKRTAERTGNWEDFLSLKRQAVYAPGETQFFAGLPIPKQNLITQILKAKPTLKAETLAKMSIPALTNMAKQVGVPAKAPEVKKTYTVWQGRGATPEQIYGEQGLELGPALGKAEYYTFNKDDAIVYGEDIKKHKVELVNPLRITSDAEWKTLTEKAGLKYPRFWDTSTEIATADRKKILKYFKNQGYDSVIVEFDKKKQTSIIEELFEHNQIIKFQPPKAPEAGQMFHRMPSGEVMSGPEHPGAVPGSEFRVPAKPPTLPIKPPKIKPSIIPVSKVKPIIRKTTGQIKVSEMIREDKAFKEVLKQEERMGKIVAAKEKELGLVEQKIQKIQSDIARGEFKGAEENLAAQMHYGKRIAQEMRLGKERLEKFKTRIAETKARSEERTEIREETNKYLKAIKKVDTSEMSPHHAKPIKDIQEIIDFTKPTKKTLSSLSATRSYLETDPEAEMPEYVLKDLKRLEKLNRDQMTLDELRSMANAVQHHAHLEKTKKTLRIRGQKRQAREILDESIAEMKPTSEVKTKIISSQKGKMAKIKHTGEIIKDTFGIRHDHYDLVIESLAGPNSTMDKILYQEVKDGIVAQLKHRQNVYKTFQKDLDLATFMKKHKIKSISSWLGERVKIGGWDLARGERMALYRHSLNENNLRHIIEGGVGFKHSGTPFQSRRVTEEDLKTILEDMGEAEREFAGTPVSNLFNNQHGAINKVFYEKSGFELGKESNYYPIEVMRTALPKDIEADSILEELKHKWVRIGLKKGMLEHRVKSKLPIYLNNIAYDINKSVMNAAAYTGLEIPLSNASKLLYDKTFKAEMYKRYSPQTWKEIEKGLRDIAGDWQSYTTVEELLLGLKNKLSTAILGVSFAIPKQILSYALYSVYVKPEYLFQGFMDWTTHPMETIKRHKLYSPEFAERIEGGYSRDVADVFKTGAEKRLYKGKTSLPEKLMGGVKFFDINAVGPGMQSAVLQVLDEFKAGKLSVEVMQALDIKEANIAKLSAEDKMKLAYKFADYTTQRTQPMFSPEHRSSLSRGTPVEKLATMFSSFTNQALNLIRRTWRTAQDTNDPMMYAKTLKALFLLLVVNTGGVMFINEIRDRIYRREERVKRGVKQKYGEAVLDSVFSYFYFLRDLERSVVSKVQRGTWLGYDLSLPVLGFGDKVGDAFANGIGALIEKDPTKKKKKAMSFIDNTIDILLTLQGIPYTTPKKLITRGGKKTSKKGDAFELDFDLDMELDFDLE